MPIPPPTNQPTNCRQFCVRQYMGSHQTLCECVHHAHHDLRIIFPFHLFSTPAESVLAVFTFDTIWSVCFQICTRPLLLKIHICVNIANIFAFLIPKEIDPVYFEKVNLVGRLGTFPADGTISKQETLLY